MPLPALDPHPTEVRVLLVDDNPTNLQVLQHTLSPLKLKLLVAKSGEDALKVALRARPQIVLLDVMMPGIDGFEVCRRLKDDDATRDAAVIFLSALDDTESKVRGLELILNDRPLDGRADLYALRCALYFAIAGRLPFAGDAMSLLVHQLKTAPETMSLLAKRPLPPELDAIGLACLAKDASERSTSARELWSRLGAIRFDAPWTEERAERWWAENLPEWADRAEEGEDEDEADDEADATSFAVERR